MSTINAANLELTLVQKINSTTAQLELLALGTALRQLQNGAVFVVQQFSQLPSSSANLGSLYFVINDGIVYVSTLDAVGGSFWNQLASDSINQLFTWGNNVCGRLGDGTTVCRSSPGTVAGGGTTWCQISPGTTRHTTAVKTDGTAWTWGCNICGILGDGTVTNRSSPGTLVGGGTTWCQISAGDAHTVAIKTDGSAWTWGFNGFGRLGDNTAANRSSPGTVSGGGTTWCHISAGYFHTAAIKTDGTAWTWGYNNYGRLGDGTVVNRSSPGTLVGGGNTWCQINAGGSHTAAIKTDGSAWTWGLNSSGQLGNSSIVNRSSPDVVSGVNECWCQINSGGNHTAAIKTDGTAWTWGNNTCGMLGDGTVVSRSSPGAVTGTNTLWCQISAGNAQTAAVKTDGTAWTWGNNTCGMLGDGTVVSRSSPGVVLGGISTWCQINTGQCITAAISSKIL